MVSRVARWALPSLVVALIGACAAPPKPAVDTAGITAAVDSLNKAFIAAIVARDTDAVVSCYAADAKVLPSGMPRADGHDAIRASWAAFLQTPGLDFSFTSDPFTISEAGDLVIDVGRYSMKYAGPRGATLEDVGKFVTVLKKVDGRWKIAVDTFNSDKATPGM